MLEFLLCSLITILPDFLFRRYVQGKRIGQEITLYSMWFELRYGIVTCVLLALALIATIFYFHPTSDNATLVFRTVPIMPEGAGKVTDVYIDPTLDTPVKAGQLIFKLNSAIQENEVEIAKQTVEGIKAQIELAKSELLAAHGALDQAKSSVLQSKEELDTRRALFNRNSGTVSERELERQQIVVDGRQGAVDAAEAQVDMVETKISIVLPAQLALAEAQLQEAEAQLAKKYVRAGVDGTVTQFMLRVGDIANQLARPAGILVPDDAGTDSLVAGFGQIEAQVIKPGMLAEAACASLPFKIIPLVVVDVQPVIAAGQVAAGERLTDLSTDLRQGTVTARMEPLYKGGLDRVPRGSRCMVNAYTSNHERLENDKDIGFLTYMALHAVDTVGIVHASLLRVHTILFPLQTLVLGGH